MKMYVTHTLYLYYSYTLIPTQHTFYFIFFISSFSQSNKLNKTTFTYDRYHNIFKSIISDLKLNNDHRPHDGRKHFITIAKKYGVDEYVIKYIVCHKISDINEKVYTNREFDF